MWNLASSSSIVSERWDNHCAQLHKRRLRNISSTLDNSAPETTKIRINRGKRAQMKREYREKVARENNMLIRKILELDSQTRLDRYRMFHRLPADYSSVPRTLNGTNRRKTLEAITKENKAVLRRIIEARPTFDRAQWTDDERERRQLASRIAARPRYRAPGGGGGGRPRSSSQAGGGPRRPFSASRGKSPGAGARPASAGRYRQAPKQGAGGFRQPSRPQTARAGGGRGGAGGGGRKVQRPRSAR